MFKVKIRFISKQVLPALALILFIISQSLSLVHKLSHDEFSVVNSESFLAKIFFTHGGENPSNKKMQDHCSFCAFSNLQNQISLAASLIFAAAIFYLTFFTRKFDRVKSSYFRSSHASRAPPKNS